MLKLVLETPSDCIIIHYSIVLSCHMVLIIFPFVVFTASQEVAYEELHKDGVEGNR